MSHFTVAVFIDGKEDLEYLECRLEKMLAPYQENNMGDCPKEYMEFHSSYKEHRAEYEHEGTQRIKFSDGTSIFPWDEEELKKKKEAFWAPGTVLPAHQGFPPPPGSGCSDFRCSC